jgi:hypothetical protein
MDINNRILSFLKKKERKKEKAYGKRLHIP